MKHCVVLACTVFVLLPVAVRAQEAAEARWEIMPSVALVRYFAGETIGTRRGYGSAFVPVDQSSSSEARYSGTGLEVKARFFHESLPNLAFTLGGGVSWYSSPEESQYGIMPMKTAGVGEIQRNRQFTAFPLSVGVQAFTPQSGRQAFMVFAGGEVIVNFIDGDIDIRQQAKLGYSVLGGFAIKVFEFGIRYTAFSDMRNLGVHIGFRVNPFTL